MVALTCQKRSRPVCEQFMTAHDIYANSAYRLYANSLWLLTTSIQIVLMPYARTEHKVNCIVDNMITLPCQKQLVGLHGHRQLKHRLYK